MEHGTAIRELIRLIGLEPSADQHNPLPTTINLSLIEQMKKEVDRQVRSDARHALNLAEATHHLAEQSGDPLAVALGFRARAQSCNALGQFHEAVSFFTEARALYQSAGQVVDAARMARSMIDPLMYLGRYDEALSLATDARAVLSANQERILLAQLDTNVGNVYHRLDQNRKALDCYERARAVFAAEDDKFALAIVTFNSANIHANLDDFRTAEALYQQAYELYHTLDLEQYAVDVKYSLGYLHFLKGEYHLATRLLHEVREEYVRQARENRVAVCDLDLAEIYLQLHVLEEAADCASRARERFQALAVPYEAARALVWLGLARLHQERLSEAGQFLQQARQEFTAEGNEVWLGLICLYLGELSLHCEQPQQALASATEAEETFVRHSLKTKTLYARLVRARALARCGETEAAGKLCAEVLADCSEPPIPWLLHQLHEFRGDQWLQAEDAGQAYDHYVLAVSFIEQIRGHIRVDEFRSAFFRDKLRVYEKLIQLCLQQESPEKQAEAFFYLESRKARTLADMVNSDLELVPASNDELQQRWRQLRAELHWYYSRVSQSETEGKSRRIEISEQLNREISQRERALAEVVRQAQIQDADFVWLRGLSGMTVSEVHAVLAADETVIEYYLTRDELFIFIIDHHRFEVFHQPVRMAELRNLILELRFQLEKFRYGAQYLAAHGDYLLRNTQECLNELHHILLAPVAAKLANRKLIVIPFDLLHNIPFQALFDGENYLLDQHEITIAPSARILALCANKPLRDGARMLIFGAADEIAPQINEEISAIQSLFPHARCFTGAGASSQALADQLPDSDIVHIASHAVYRQDNPMFSAFRLADTWLNFYDVCAMRTPASLVTLSGCSTGTNYIYAGDELLGLVRGFLTAGASALVVSLWAVNDPATARLMTEFYQCLQRGLPPRAALRDAALQIRQQYAHPYYWAPFICLGHDRKHSVVFPSPPASPN